MSPRIKLIARIVLVLFIAVCGFGMAGAQFSSAAAGNAGKIRLQGHVPEKQKQKARKIGAKNPQSKVALSLAMPLRNDAELEDLLARMYDPADPLYGKFLSQDEFKARFSPTPEEYDAWVKEKVGVPKVTSFE